MTKSERECIIESLEDKLTLGGQFIFDWQYDRFGRFKKALMAIIVRADAENTFQLKKAFPIEVEAYWKYCNSPGWWNNVQKKAGI